MERKHTENVTNEMVVEKYYELHTIAAVAKHFNKRPSTISTILKESGINTKSRSKYKVNPHTNEKICTKCLTPKSLDSYMLNKLGKYSASCRSCLSEVSKERSRLNKEQYHRDPEYREKVKKWSSDWGKNNRDKRNKMDSEYYHKNKDYFKEKGKKYHRQRWDSDPEHREKINNASKERFQDLYYNDEEYRQKCIDSQVEYHRTRYHTDELYKFKTDIRRTVYRAFKRKGFDKNSESRQILGAEWDVIKDYIESQFSEGMTWDNYGEWVFDHKIPVSICKTEEETIRLNHYTNFQPLWLKENLFKSDKILPEFEHLIDDYLGDIRDIVPPFIN
jgi:hypothetical protein